MNEASPLLTDRLSRVIPEHWPKQPTCPLGQPRLIASIASSIHDERLPRGGRQLISLNHSTSPSARVSPRTRRLHPAAPTGRVSTVNAWTALRRHRRVRRSERTFTSSWPITSVPDRQARTATARHIATMTPRKIVLPVELGPPKPDAAIKAMRSSPPIVTHRDVVARTTHCPSGPRFHTPLSTLNLRWLTRSLSADDHPRSTLLAQGSFRNTGLGESPTPCEPSRGLLAAVPMMRLAPRSRQAGSLR